MDKSKVRQAVGAIVFQNGEYLLVYKVKSINAKTDIAGHWDFIKGGVKESDEDLEAAVLRELKEETGSNQYRIIKKYTTKISFVFPKGHKYDRQETDMFLVEYLGNRTDLQPQDEEIKEIRFYSRDEVISLLYLEETSNFLKDVIW